MAQANLVKVTGVATSEPAASALFTPASFQGYLDLGLEATYGSAKGTQRGVASPSAPVTIDPEGITKIRFFALRLLSGGTMQVWVTTSLGVAKLPVSDEFVWHAPNPGDEATAVQVQGTADFQYLMAGDVT